MGQRMKDIVKEIAVQAKIQMVSEPRLEEFTELIVKKCMEQVWYTYEDKLNENISEVIKERIKETFGVQE
jgi:predicted house-cleaning noncanonical NTP pyrophosphatase (MazG superfamily)